MNDNEQSIQTEYGVVKLSATPCLGAELENTGTYQQLKEIFPIAFDASVLNEDVPTDNDIEVDDDPANTYGLASKKYLYETMKNHSLDKDAHSDVFNSIMKKFSDLYEQHGELKAFQISDTYGNIIYANGKVVPAGQQKAKYVVVSSKRLQDFDALEKRVKDLEEKVLSLEGGNR